MAINYGLLVGELDQARTGKSVVGSHPPNSERNKHGRFYKKYKTTCIAS